MAARERRKRGPSPGGRPGHNRGAGDEHAGDNKSSERGRHRHRPHGAEDLLEDNRRRSAPCGRLPIRFSITPLAAVDKIQRGLVYIERVTIPEGYNRFDIAETLAAKTAKATKEEFLRLTADQTPILPSSPQARDLEGYLFPDTYNYNTKTTPAELIRAMVARFNEVFTPEWRARARELKMSVHEVVTLASIIEEEARVPEERARISSVFHNRLKQGSPLGSDPTFIYASILAGDYDGNPNQPRHRQRDSRYNTYIYAGLPPGPIASPGRASLEAALYPEQTDYLYFVVSGTEGRHKFSRTAAEHDAAVQEYRRQQREQQSK